MLLFTNYTVCDNCNLNTHKLYGILHVCDNQNVTYHKLYGILLVYDNQSVTYVVIIQSIHANYTVYYMYVIIITLLLTNYTAYSIFVFHFLKHYYNGIFHISFFKALLINEGETTRGKREQGKNDSRGETTRIQGELTPTAFRLVLSAGKLNLPLVPSQDYVLQDNKRCYDKSLSDWNFRFR